MSYFCFTEWKVSVRWFPLHSVMYFPNLELCVSIINGTKSSSTYFVNIRNSIMYFPNLELCVSGLAKENQNRYYLLCKYQKWNKIFIKKLFFQLTNANQKFGMMAIKFEIVFNKKPTNCICYSILLRIFLDKSHLPKKSWYLFDLKNNHTEGDYVLPMNQSLV
jgi:hypothetical protein